MALQPREQDLLSTDVAPFTQGAGDRRTARLLGEAIRGIIGSERLVGRRIAAFSPPVGRRPA